MGLEKRQFSLEMRNKKDSYIRMQRTKMKGSSGKQKKKEFMKIIRGNSVKTKRYVGANIET